MDIPLNTIVQCVDGLCGRSTYVIINPTTHQVTHLVVKASQPPHREYLVPEKLILETIHNLIRLRCTMDELAQMETFVETDYVRAKMPEPKHLVALGYLLWPYVMPEPTKTTSVKYKRIPPHELAIRRGARVAATDGYVGQVGEFLVDPEDGHITHLMLQEGHLWGQKEVAIPVSEIDRFDDKEVLLKLNKAAIAKLPTIRVRRW